MSQVSLGATGRQVVALQIVVSALCNAHKEDENFLKMVNAILDGVCAANSTEEAAALRMSVKGIISG